MTSIPAFLRLALLVAASATVSGLVLGLALFHA